MTPTAKVVFEHPVAPPPAKVVMEIPFDVAVLIRAFLGGGVHAALKHATENGCDAMYSKYLTQLTKSGQKRPLGIDSTRVANALGKAIGPTVSRVNAVNEVGA